MVTRAIVPLISFLFSIFTHAQSNVDKNSELPRSYKTTFIKQIVIKENGAWSEKLSSSDETPEDCSIFILKEGDVRDYFISAKRIDFSLFNYLPFSRCYTTGEIVFKNGDHGTWFIDSWRRGHLTLTNGKTAYFYGLKAHAKVFAEGDPYYNDPSHNYAKQRSVPRVKISTIKSISFRKDHFLWYLSDEQKAGKCKFELSESDVKDFFFHAKTMTQKDFGMIRPSSCHIEGEIEFDTGQKGSWMIESGRRGILQMNQGGKAYLYAKDAKAKAFEIP